MFDFSKISGEKKYDTAINPRDIFDALPSKDSTKFSYPRDVQSQVWSKWFNNRDKECNVIKMNTGGGKTLVGLLILKSCLNEKRGPAVYVVPDKYLLEQVVREAKSLGIDVVDSVEDSRFLTGQAIFVANIYKIVNGQSVFGVGNEGIKIEIGSVLIDDAHACFDIVDQQYTLTIESSSDLYNKMLNLFKDDLEHQGETEYQDLISNDSSVNIEVPFWAWDVKKQEVNRLLREYSKDFIFHLPLLKNNLAHCHCVFGASSIEIKPHCIPIHEIPALNECKRKIFMTATLTDNSVLISHFGLNENEIDEPIVPETAGDVGERLIIVTNEVNPNITDDDIKAICIEFAKENNVLIITPSKTRATFWNDIADLTLDKSNINDSVENIKKNHIGIIVLINRYDGVDLPHDACRLLIIDGLPDTASRYDNIVRRSLNNSGAFVAGKIQKVEQGMGRGVRSNDDYCVVLLTGKQIVKQLYVNNAIKNFSPATRTQFDISSKLIQQIRGKGVDEVIGAINLCIKRDKEWIALSKSALSGLKYDNDVNVDKFIVALRKAYDLAKHNDQMGAVEALQEFCNLPNLEPKTKGYAMRFLAEHINVYDKVESQKVLLAAYKHNHRIMKPIDGISYIQLITKNSQAFNIISYIDSFDKREKVIFEINEILDGLQFNCGSANRFEEAFKQLGRALGFLSQRPELEFGKGPDNLWGIGSNKYLVVECKSEAVVDRISKGYCNQLNGSGNWFEQNYNCPAEYVPIMVHKSNLFEFASSPSSTTKILNEKCLGDLKDNVKKLYNALLGSPKLDESKVNEQLLANNLMHEQIVGNYTVPYKVAIK